MPIISGGGSGGGSGAEIGYDAITANVNLVGTTEGAATTVITCAAHNFDGAAVMLQVFSPAVLTDTGLAGHTVNVGLYEGGAIITRIGNIQTPAAGQMGVPFNAFLRFTPTAGSHTYTIQAFVSATTGTPVWVAGLGGAGAFNASFARFTKV